MVMPSHNHTDQAIHPRAMVASTHAHNVHRPLSTQNCSLASFSSSNLSHLSVSSPRNRIKTKIHSRFDQLAALAYASRGSLALGSGVASAAGTTATGTTATGSTLGATGKSSVLIVVAGGLGSTFGSAFTGLGTLAISGEAEAERRWLMYSWALLL